MANKVFNDSLDGLLNTPTNVPGWTVQNAATGSDQSTVNGGAAPSGAGALLAASEVTAQSALGSAQTTAVITATGSGGADWANLAKLADLKAVAAAVDALNAALVAAGIEV